MKQSNYLKPIIIILFVLFLSSSVFAFNLFRPSTWFVKEQTNTQNREFGGFGNTDGFGGGRSGGGGAGGGFGDPVIVQDNNEVVVIPIIITNGTCPGLCDVGFAPSSIYPNNYKFENTTYLGKGTLCYKCNLEKTIATRCDPRTGRIIGNEINLSSSVGEIIKQEICPDEFNIEIDIPFPEIGDLPVEEVTITPVELQIQQIGEIYDLGPGMFDCNVLKKSTLTERFSFDYNYTNSNYYIDGTDWNAISMKYNGSIVDINISKNYLNSKYDFKQTKDFASVCFIDDIALPELKDLKYYVKEDSVKLTNGYVLSKLTILPGGRKVEVCINRPINKLSDLDRLISEKVYLGSNNTEKTFKIKKKVRFWFDKTIKEIKFSLSAELGAFGCDEVLINIPQITTSRQIIGPYIPTAAGSGKCYSPNGKILNGLTGLDNYKRYGFDRLLFIYDLEGIKHNFCDYGEKYCDQDQLKVTLLKKAKLIEEQKVIILDGITFNKSEDNKIDINPIVYLDNIQATINQSNIINSEFSYSEDPDEYLNTLINSLNSIPPELRKFVILDVTFTNKVNNVIGISISENEIIERLDKMSGNKKYNYLRQISTETNAKRFFTNPMKDVYSYQITLDSFLENEPQFREYLNSSNSDYHFKSKNLVYFTQLIENMKIYYGDSVSPVLVNTKTYGSLENGLTKNIFTSIQFMNELNKPIALLSTSEVKEINSPGLYLYELSIENNNIKYNVKNTSSETKKFLDYYNMQRFQEYKQNILFTNPINAIYKNYVGVPFKFDDSEIGSTFGNATVYSNYSAWNDIQDGYVLKIKSDNTQIENISFKNIRPIQIISSGDYNYNYIKPNGRYSDKINISAGKETIFAFLEHAERNPQIVIESENDLTINRVITPENRENKKIYNMPNNLRTPNQTTVDFEDLFSGIETAHVGYMLTLIKHDQVCFNLTNNQINFWLNPEKTTRNSSNLEYVNLPITQVLSNNQPSSNQSQSNTPPNPTQSVPTNNSLQVPTYEIQGNFLEVTNSNTGDIYMVLWSKIEAPETNYPCTLSRNKCQINLTGITTITIKVCSTTKTGTCSSSITYTK